MENEELGTKRSAKKEPSNREVAALRAEWVDELVRGCRTEQDLFGPVLTSRVFEVAPRRLRDGRHRDGSSATTSATAIAA